MIIGAGATGASSVAMLLRSSYVWYSLWREKISSITVLFFFRGRKENSAFGRDRSQCRD